MARVQESNEEEEETSSELQIVPNPATDQFSVGYYSSSAQMVTIKIIDLTSRVVVEREVKAVQGFNKELFNAHGLKAGLYMIHLSATDIKEVKKLLIE